LLCGLLFGTAFQTCLPHPRNLSSDGKLAPPHVLAKSASKEVGLPACTRQVGLILPSHFALLLELAELAASKGEGNQHYLITHILIITMTPPLLRKHPLCASNFPLCPSFPQVSQPSKGCLGLSHVAKGVLAQGGGYYLTNITTTAPIIIPTNTVLRDKPTRLFTPVCNIQ